MRTWIWMGMLVAVGACGERSATDIAALCIEAPGGETSTLASGEWSLTATAGSGCHTRDMQVSCDVEVDGDTLYVTVEQTWVRTEPLAMGCEMILRQTSAECDLPELDDGVYTVVYANQEMSLALPEPQAECIHPEGKL